MLNISSFLERFKTLGAAELLLKEELASAITQIIRVPIERKSITIKNGVVFVKCSPAVKSAIFINKLAIMEKIKHPSAISDVR